MLQWLVDHLDEQSLLAGYAFVFGVLVFCGFGFPMPEDIVLVTGGVLAWLASPMEDVALRTMFRDPGLLKMCAVGLAGIVCGDSVIYLMGRRFGGHIAEHRILRRFITAEKIAKVEQLMRRRGTGVILGARFLPGLRAPAYFTAGHARFPYWKFIAFDGMAALISAPFWIGVGFYFGHDVERAAKQASKFAHVILVFAAALAAILVFRWILKQRAAAPATVVEGPLEMETGPSKSLPPPPSERRSS